MIKQSIKLTVKHSRIAEYIGDGNKSEGVRRAINSSHNVFKEWAVYQNNLVQNGFNHTKYDFKLYKTSVLISDKTFGIGKVLGDGSFYKGVLKALELFRYGQIIGKGNKYLEMCRKGMYEKR